MTSVDTKTNNIYTTRGDDLNLDFKISTDLGEYEFEPGDVVRIGIYGERKMNKDAVLIKDFEIEEPTPVCNIFISGEDMKLGNLINRPKKYWYEIILNGDLTVVGYSKDKPAILTLLPEGSDIVANIDIDDDNKENDDNNGNEEDRGEENDGEQI